jgi:CheY-like chemotaxis protein
MRPFPIPVPPTHVLVIDDDPDVLALLRDLLADEGHRVTARPCADLSPAAVAALAPDAIVLDCLAPGTEGGWALLEGLRADPATALVPIVLCPAAGPRAVAALVPRLARLAVRLVPKPFDIDRLATAVAAALGRDGAGDGGTGWASPTAAAIGLA